MTLPLNITAGTTVEYSRPVPGYSPTDGWIYSLHIAAPGFPAQHATTSQGDVYSLTLQAADTAKIPAGQYRFSERVTRSGVVREINTGLITVAPDLATTNDSRTHAQRTLAILEAAIEGRLTDGIVNYSIAGRAVSKIPASELAALINNYRIRVRAEKLAQSGRFGTFGTLYATT